MPRRSRSSLNVTPEMIRAALRALDPFKDQQGYLAAFDSTVWMGAALRAALEVCPQLDKRVPTRPDLGQRASALSPQCYLASHGQAAEKRRG